MTLDEKRGQTGIVSAVLIILGSLIFVSAALTNSTNESFGNNLSSNLSNETLFQNSQISILDSQIVSGQLEISSNISVTGQEQVTQNETINISRKKHILTKVFNEDNLDFDRGYRIKYLNQRNNFSGLYFKKVVDKEDTTFTVGARNDNVRGFNINNQNFAIDLIDCDSWERYCAFRINGVPTKKLFPLNEFGNSRKNSFYLDDNYVVKINSIQFDFCDNRRFCHLGYEGYHVVDVLIERKNES